MTTASVSVVCTVYNGAWCIRRAIDAVLAQTAPASEVLICDDGSTDGTADLVESEYSDPVRVLRLPHRNAAATRSEGLAIAKGEWFAFLDADDWWAPTKLERQLTYLAEHPEVRWLSTDGDYVGSEGLVRPSWLSDYFEPVRELHGDLLPLLVERCFPLMSSMLVNRHAYHAVGGMHPEIVYSHDYDLWARLAARFPGAVLPERLVSYWTSPGQLSRRYSARHLDDLHIMEDIAAGVLREDPSIQRQAAVRAAAIAYILGVTELRGGDAAKARDYFRRARRAGPWHRRALAWAGTLVPPAAVGALARSRALKALVARGLPRPGAIRDGKSAW